MIVITAEIILAVLKLVNMILGAVERDKWIAAGRDEAVAEATKAILARTVAGKKIMDKVNAMSDDELDAAFRQLEPK